MAILGVAATVVLVIGYSASASTLQEDLQSPARYLAQHAQKGDVIALSDHAVTSVFEYYLADDKRLIPLWPQLGVQQRYVEGFDLSLHPSGEDCPAASGSWRTVPYRASMPSTECS